VTSARAIMDMCRIMEEIEFLKLYLIAVVSLTLDYGGRREPQEN